ncbi:hypothetical protein OAM69_02250 [bacterium]|nr:hypothetical protein [bacterium]
MPTFISLAERRSFWKQHVTACSDSGLSKSGHCRKHPLTYHQLIYWVSQLDTQPAKSCVDPKPVATLSHIASQLLPVVMRDHQQGHSGIQITLPGGLLISGIRSRMA